MKKHLTKIYNIFKQIEQLNGSTGWDQTSVFYYFYEENNLEICWQLLYGLFCENKQLSLSKFGISLSLTDLRKLAKGKSAIYEFGNSEEPILITEISRNGKNQPIGKVHIDNPITGEEKTVEFVEGIKVSENTDSEIDFVSVSDEDVLLLVLNYIVICYHDDNDELIEITNQEDLQEYTENYDDNRLFVWKDELLKNNLTENFKNELVNSEKKLPELIEWEKTYLKNENRQVALKMCNSLGGDTKWLINLSNLLRKKNVDYNFFETYIINVDKLTSEEIKDLSYVEDRIDTHLKDIDDSTENSVLPTFTINDITPDSLESIDDVEAFLNYLYDDCGLLGAFHPDDSFDNYLNNEGNELFTEKQQELYSKYIDDLYELDSDGESIFVIAGYEDIYDYCLNYRNDSHSSDNQKEKFLHFLQYKVLNDYQLDKNSSGYLGFINFEPSADFNGEEKEMVIWIENNFEIANKIANTLGLNIQSAFIDELIIDDSLTIDNNFVAYLEDDQLCVGIKSKIQYNNDFVDVQDGTFVNYIYFQPGDEDTTNLTKYNNLIVIWDNTTNSWTVKSNNGFYEEVLSNLEKTDDVNITTDSLEFLVNLNNIDYWCSLSVTNEETKLNAEFYQFTENGELNESTLVGDCDIYVDENLKIESIEWTLPEYEDIIDPIGELHDLPKLLEKIIEII